MSDKRTNRKVKVAAPSVRLRPSFVSFATVAEGSVPPDLNSPARLAEIETSTHWLNKLSTEDVISLIPVLVKHAEY